MRGAPVSRDLGAGRDPYIVVCAHVLEEPVERRRASRAADDPAVEPNREHAPAFRAEPVERVHEVGGEVVGGDEAAREQELEVVRSRV